MLYLETFGLLVAPMVSTLCLPKPSILDQQLIESVVVLGLTTEAPITNPVTTDSIDPSIKTIAGLPLRLVCS